MHRLEETATPFNIIMAIIGYSICSSTMLLANKVAIVFIPNPVMISFIQVVFATVIVYLIQLLQLDRVDNLEWSKIKPYLLYIVFFFSSIYANMKALAVSNVETVIVFRSCTPIAVCIIEYFFMNRALPSFKSSLSLGSVALGAILYCYSDSQLQLEGLSSYSWVMTYFLLITLEMTYGKQLTSTVRMDSVWGPVFYCNTLSVLPFFIMATYEKNISIQVEEFRHLSTYGYLVIFFSCIVGTLIGYTSWLCRSMLSATTFTLVGVVNKFLTILLNVIIWEKHSSSLGIMAVSICLLAGVFYEQPPKRSDPKKDMKEDVESPNGANKV